MAERGNGGIPSPADNRFDLEKGKKLAGIFSWGLDSDDSVHPNQNDIDLITRAVRKNGFKFIKDTVPSEGSRSRASSHSYDEMDTSEPEDDVEMGDGKENVESQAICNVTGLDLVATLKEIGNACSDVSVLLLYFVLRKPKENQGTPEFIYTKDKTQKLLESWKYFKGVICPKIFIIQEYVLEKPELMSSLLNANDEQMKMFSLPESANTLVAYLPVFGDSLAGQVLNEELKTPYDINTILTSVLARTTSEYFSPRFSSTLLKLLHLGNESNSNLKQLPHYNIKTNQKCLVYTFLFGEFNGRMQSLMSSLRLDEDNLRRGLNHMGFTNHFCIQNGKMNVSDFMKTLKSILNCEKKMKSCECIAIIISSHGNENGTIYASDKEFTRDDVLNALTNCRALDGKPKLLIVDACRGNEAEKPSLEKVPEDYHTALSKRAKQGTKAPKLSRGVMPDVLQILSSTELNQSFTSQFTGSVLIKTLCNHLIRYGSEHHLMTILNAVMKEVALMNIDLEMKQQVTFTSTLTKLLKFP